MRQRFPVYRDLPAFDLILRQILAKDVRDDFGTLASFDAGNEIELLIDRWIKIDSATVA
jgi:hypothetical protein